MATFRLLFRFWSYLCLLALLLALCLALFLLRRFVSATVLGLNSAQRTNFKPTLPRIATKPGQMRQVKPRSKNRGKADPAAALKRFAAFKP